MRHHPELAGLPDVPLVLPLRFRYKKGDPARLAGMVRRSIYAIVKGVVEAASELARARKTA